jgi:hypothetical protein
LGLEDGGRALTRLDEETLETLLGWGKSLAGDPRAEVRAAGRAILVLIDEIGRLNGELGKVVQGTDRTSVEQLYEDPLLAEGAAASDELASTLRSRLRGLARR